MLSGCGDPSADGGPLGELSRVVAGAAQSAPPAGVVVNSTIPLASLQPLIDVYRRVAEVEVVAHQVGVDELGVTGDADLVLADDVGLLVALEATERCRPLGSRLRLRVPEAFRSHQGFWVGIGGRARVLVFDKRRTLSDAMPRSLSELTEPAWRARVGWVPTSPSFVRSVAVLLQLQGAQEIQDWLRLMVVNAVKPYDSDALALQAVERGDIDVAWVDYDALPSLSSLPSLPSQKGAPRSVLTAHFFRDARAASLLLISGAAVMKRSTEPEAAARLLEFLLGRSAQQHLVAAASQWPLASGAAQPAALPSLGGLRLPPVRWSELRDMTAAKQQLRNVGIATP